MIRASNVIAAAAFAAGISASAPTMAQTIGMVADNLTSTVTVFDADTNTVIGFLSIPVGS